MDIQQEIERVAEALAQEKSCSLIDALNMLQSRYESDRRIEEALIVNRLIDRELAKVGKEGFIMSHSLGHTQPGLE